MRFSLKRTKDNKAILVLRKYHLPCFILKGVKYYRVSDNWEKDKQELTCLVSFVNYFLRKQDRNFKKEFFRKFDEIITCSKVFLMKDVPLKEADFENVGTLIKSMLEDWVHDSNLYNRFTTNKNMRKNGINSGFAFYSYTKFLKLISYIVCTTSGYPDAVAFLAKHLITSLERLDPGMQKWICEIIEREIRCKETRISKWDPTYKCEVFQSTFSYREVTNRDIQPFLDLVLVFLFPSITDFNLTYHDLKYSIADMIFNRRNRNLSYGFVTKDYAIWEDRESTLNTIDVKYDKDMEE